MGKIKYQAKIKELFKKSPVVSYKSVENIIKNKKEVKQYTKQLIRNLLLKGKIKRLTKGFYTSSDDISLSVFCFKPAYLGLQDALSFHGLWEQETIPVIITSRRVTPGIRKVIGGNILIRRIHKQYFFGFDYFSNDNICLPYSDIEKTFIDIIYFKEKIDSQVIKNIIKILDIKKLNSYLKVYPKQTRNRVLGYIRTRNSIL